MLEALQPAKDPGWVLTHEGYNVMTENAVESRFALGDGFLGMRASRPVICGRGTLQTAQRPRQRLRGGSPTGLRQSSLGETAR